MQPDKPLHEPSKKPAPNVNWVGLMFILAWPVLRWVFAFDVLIQVVRLLYHWNDGMFWWAALRVIVHFAGYVAAYCWVANYRTPKL